MLRRIHTKVLARGDVPLDDAAAHHTRDVLRLGVGSPVELFDDDGATAGGEIVACSPTEVIVRVGEVATTAAPALRLTIASAVPKANRADWMIEKLSELGVDRFIPLQTARSVVHPDGKNKLDRWQRLATEAARQSRRRGVMTVLPLTHIEALLAGTNRSAPPRPGQSQPVGWFCSTSPAARAIRDLLSGPLLGELILCVGPEGGWTTQEEAAFEVAGFVAVALTDTVLRIETATLAAAALTLLVARSRADTSAVGAPEISRPATFPGAVPTTVAIVPGGVPVIVPVTTDAR